MYVSAHTHHTASVLHEAAGTFANITPPFESITKSKTGLFPHTQGFSDIYAQYTQCFEDVYTTRLLTAHTRRYAHIKV